MSFTKIDKRRTMRPSLFFVAVVLVLVVCILPISLAAAAAAAAANEDLYQILGVSRQASTKEIKTSYRRRALESHPDKNKNVPPEQAAEEFHKVVHAFEVLSDTEARRIYDRTGQATAPGSGNSRGGGGGGGESWSFTFSRKNQRMARRQTIPLKDRFKVQEAMSRVLNVHNLNQLKIIMLKDPEYDVQQTEEEVLENLEEDIEVDNVTVRVTSQIKIKMVTETTTTIHHKTVERNLVRMYVWLQDIECSTKGRGGS